MSTRNDASRPGDEMRQWTVYLVQFVTVLAVGAYLSGEMEWSEQGPTPRYERPYFIPPPTSEQLRGRPGLGAPAPVGTPADSVDGPKERRGPEGASPFGSPLAPLDSSRPLGR